MILIVLKGINTCSDLEIWIWITAEPNWGLIQFSPDFDDIKIWKQARELLINVFDVYTPDSNNHSAVVGTSFHWTERGTGSVTGPSQRINNHWLTPTFAHTVRNKQCMSVDCGRKPRSNMCTEACHSLQNKLFKLLQRTHLKSHCALVEINKSVAVKGEQDFTPPSGRLLSIIWTKW